MDKPGDLYLPSNGMEGECFFESWCCLCARDKSMREGEPIDEVDDNEKCDIIANSFCGPVPEWIYDAEGIPCCTAYSEDLTGTPEVDTHTLPLF